MWIVDRALLKVMSLNKLAAQETASRKDPRTHHYHLAGKANLSISAFHIITLHSSVFAKFL